jgi:type IV pilus assembly protein PilV
MRRVRRQDGFTLIELMIALTVLVIGLLGVLGIIMVSLKNSSFSRHGTEAAILAEDKLEELRTQTGLASGTEASLDARGTITSDGIYTRAWTVTDVTDPTLGNFQQIEVQVSWNEGETGTRQIVMRTERLL